MAIGTGNLPNPGMAFTPFDILTAEEMNMMVDNIESLATGVGIGDGAITSDKIDFTTQIEEWKTLPITGNVKLYSSVPIRYRKVGNTVEVIGAVSPADSSAVSAGNGIIAILPEGYRFNSVQSISALQQGSGSDYWLLSVYSTGTLRWERYSGTLTTSVWMPFFARFTGE